MEIFIGPQFLHLDTSSSFERSVAIGFAMLGGPVLSFVSGIIGSIAHISPTLAFKEVVASYYFGSWYKLFRTLSASVRQQALTQAYKIFGSIEVLGDPLSLVDSVGSGVVQFYRETRAEMIGNSTTRGEGLRKLVQSVVGGTAGSASKITGSLAELMHATAGGSREPAGPGNNAGERAAKILVRSLVQGVTGLIDAPRQGLRMGGALGAVTGVLRGVVNLVTAPLAGTLGAVSVGLSGIESGMRGHAVGRRSSVRDNAAPARSLYVAGTVSLSQNSLRVVEAALHQNELGSTTTSLVGALHVHMPISSSSNTLASSGGANEDELF
jgi:hypothetical protein